MKKLFTMVVLLLSVNFAQPTIDGNYFDDEGWGTAVSTADGTVGWNSTNVTALYVTFDATYIYLAATFTGPSTWQKYGFVINTVSGGGNTDPWDGDGNITFAHSNLPDYVIRGNMGDPNVYSELHSWNGSGWVRSGSGQITLISGVERGVSLTCVEYRIPKTSLGSASAANVQFFMGGNSTSHGSFDAVPNDDNYTGWGDPADPNGSTLVNYSPETALPVELSSFTSSVSGATVQLNWATATEVDNYGFEVERSVDNVSFSKIGFVAGAGNSNVQKQYSYSDANLAAGTYYYRLKQVDTDGSFEYSQVVKSEVVGTPTEFSLSQNYPNPFNPSTAIAFALPKESNVKLSVYNMLGEEVAVLVNGVMSAGNHSVDFSATNLNSGMYVYRIEAGEFSSVRKMTLLK